MAMSQRLAPLRIVQAERDQALGRLLGLGQSDTD